MGIARKQVWSVILVALLTLVASVFGAFATAFASDETTDQSYKPATFTGSQTVGKVSNVTTSVFQTFITEKKGKITAVEFYKTGEVGTAGLGNLKVEIVQVSGGKPTNTMIATAFISKPIANGWNSVKFDTPASVTKNTSYAIKFSCNTCENGSYYQLGDNTASINQPSGYTNGSVFRKRSNNVNFFNSAQTDLGFVTIMDVPSANADLSSLALSEGTLSPSFDAASTSYTAQVPYTQSTVKVTASSVDELASIKVDGVSVASGIESSEINLAVGSNTIDVEVTAEDTDVVKTYSIEITREQPSTESRLDSLSTSIGSVDPVFSSDTLTYDVKVSYEDTKIALTPVVKESNATVTVGTFDVDSGSASDDIALAIGNNPVVVVVTAQDGLTTSTYTVNVFRQPAAVVISSPVQDSGVADVTPTLSGTAYPGATVSILIDTVEVTQVTADQDGNWEYVVVTDLAEASHDLKVVDTQFADNSASLSFYVDVTGPIISYTIDTIKSGDWYAEEVFISFSCTDDFSAITTCPTLESLSESGADQFVEVTAVDSLGNTSTLKVEDIDIDVDGPDISYNITTIANANGWYNQDVVIEFTCTDSLSGVFECPQTQTISTEGEDQTLTVSAIDNIGNVSELTIEDIHVDKTAPTIDYLISADFDGLWYSSSVTITFSCDDTLSGVDTCNDEIVLYNEGIANSETAYVTDKAGNKTSVTISDLNIDYTVPVITVTPSTTANANGWYNSSVTLTFTCTDNVSGVFSCPDPQVLSDEGDNSVEVESIDVAGNLLVFVSDTYKIDTNAPDVEYEITGDYSNGWYTSDVTISFTCEDEVSGVVNCPGEVSLTTEGTNTNLVFIVSDYADNSTTITLDDIKIDKTAPTIVASPSETANAEGWYNTAVTLTFTCDDNESGVVSCLDPIVVSAEGTTTVEYDVVDNAGNITEFSIEIKIDSVNPEVEYVITGDYSNDWYTSDVTINFTCDDVTSGVVSCPSDVTLSTEGIHSGLDYTITDYAGNSTSISIDDIKIDKTAPTLTVTPSATANGFGWYNTAVTLSFTCDDSVSGVVNCPDPITVSAEGTTTIEVEIVDNAGNVTEYSTTINIDTIAPGFEYTLTGDLNNGWYTSDVTISFACIEEVSGVVSCLDDVVVTDEGTTAGLEYTIYDFAGNSSTISIPTIQIDKTAPEISATPTTLANDNGWYNSEVTIEFTCSDELSGTALCPEPITLTESGENLSVQVEATDAAGNTIIFTIDGINIDLDAPTVEYTITGTKNGEWYTSDVVISFTCTDALSGIISCPSDITITNDGITYGDVYTIEDLAGNIALISVEDIQVDKTKPEISSEIVGTPNANGWYTSPVTVNFVCADFESGLDECASPITLTQAGSNLSATGNATDIAGNSNSTNVTGIKLDLAAPSAIADLSVDKQSQTSIELKWSAATDDVAVVKYEIYKNGVLLASVTSGTKYADNAVVAGVTYIYTIKAIDAAGRESSGNALTVTVPGSNKATIYYKVPSTWNGVSYIHYRPNGGVWTVSPGTKMTASTIAGYNVITVDLGAATGLTAAFNNGAGAWDNNGAKDYTIPSGISTIENNTVKSGEPFVDTTAPTVPANIAPVEVQATLVTLSWSPSTDNVSVKGYLIYRNGSYLNVTTGTSFTDKTVAANTTYSYTIRAYDNANNRSDLTTALSVKTATANTVKVYYKVPTGTVSFIHYRPTGGAWTVAPGVAMTASSYAGYNVATLNIGTATGIEAAFNNGAGTWDNNLTSNYLIPMGTNSVTNRVITAGEPVLDSVAPTVPTNLASSNVTQTGFTVSWTASTDNTVVSGYNVYRNGAYVTSVTGTTYTFTGLTAATNSKITVLAYDIAKNRSALSSELNVTTISAP